MLADGGAPGAAAVTVLCDIDFLAGRKGGHAKAGHSVVPKELAILARRAGESVNRALGNPARCHGIHSRYRAYRRAWQAPGKRNYANSSAREKSREISIAGNQRDYEHRGIGRKPGNMRPSNVQFDGRIVSFRDIVPIHEIVDRGLEIIGSAIPVIDVIGVLPDI